MRRLQAFERGGGGGHRRVAVVFRWLSKGCVPGQAKLSSMPAPNLQPSRHRQVGVESLQPPKMWAHRPGHRRGAQIPCSRAVIRRPWLAQVFTHLHNQRRSGRQSCCWESTSPHSCPTAGCTQPQLAGAQRPATGPAAAPPLRSGTKSASVCLLPGICVGLHLLKESA